MLPWWVPVVASLVGVVVGFTLSAAKDTLSRRRRRAAHWAALRAEIEVCRRMAETYCNDNVAAPLYRLPLLASSHSLPALLSEGAVNEAETTALIEFFAQVETLNRGLDLAQAARDRNDQMALSQEVQRNRMKAQRLRPSDATPNYYRDARAVVETHL